ncbi:unnamed protein product [Adineta ricciae]|uniref:Uncharacterized protein n=1 Tax=Adineta ricciae TaxID=249248 RepID=A0A816EP73_ADIRI|nr:unnamed protein product [Adineta ricciae]CAF1650646.1 unnamed protein product [Adineta ricciae]
MADEDVRKCVLNELNQATKTENAKTKYEDSVKQNAPSNVQKDLHDNKVWEETKSHALAHATNEAAATANAAKAQTQNTCKYSKKQ